MTKVAENQFTALLTELGFVAESRPNSILWRYAAPPPPPPAPSSTAALAEPQEPRQSRAEGRGSLAGRAPWRLESLELAERKGRLQVHKLVVRLDRQALTQRLAAATKKYLGARTRADFAPGRDGRDGNLWCVFEFSRPGSREKTTGVAKVTAGGELLPHGLGGFDLRLSTDGGALAVVVSDAFGVGFLPTNFVSAPMRLVADALGLKKLGSALVDKMQPQSLHEQRVPLLATALICLAERAAPPARLLQLFDWISVGKAPTGQAALPAPIQTAVTRQEITLSSPGTEDLLADLASGAGNFGAKARALPAVPLEALEARERGRHHADLDAALLASKYKRAAKLALAALEREPGDLFLLRRLAMIGLTGHLDWSAPLSSAAFAAEPDTKLFLAVAANQALSAGDQPATLRLLSRLGARLAADVDGFETLSSFDLVLPELLGDAWCNEDRRRAEDCYLRILQRRGDLPRVLRKLIHLARAASRYETESLYLRRLIQVERRRSELAKLYVRLAELKQGSLSGRDESIQLALRALKLDPTQFGAAILAGEQLVQRGEGTEAVALLDGILRDAGGSLSPRARSRLEAFIGRTWLRTLGRPDLAGARLEQAVAHDAANIEALKDLEELYRHRQDPQGLATVLESRFDAHEKSGDSDALHQTFEELAALYRNVLGDPRKAYELYQRLLMSASVGHQDIDRVLAWRDVEIDWQDLYAKLVAKLAQVPAGETRGRFLCRLGEICREKLQDDESALQHMREALDAGWIDAGGFDFLVERLTRVGDYGSLARAYERRIEQVDVAQRRHLVLELLTLPEALSEARRDELAIQAYALDPTVEKVVHQRLQHYQRIDDVRAVATFIEALITGTGARELMRIRWLRVGIEALSACIDEQRFVLTDRLYRQLLDAGEDRVKTLRDAVASLQDAPDAGSSGLIVPYIAWLLEANELPQVDERMMLRHLAGLDHELAQFHRLMSQKAVSAQEAAQHARTAAALYAKRANQEANTEKMLGRVALLVPCSEADIAQLKALVDKTGNWTLFAKVLQKQAEFEDEGRRKLALLEGLGRIQWQKLRDYDKARQAWTQAAKLGLETWRMKTALVAIAAEAKHVEHERRALIDLLNDPAAVEQVPTLDKVVQRLLKLGEAPASLQKLIMPMIVTATATGRDDLAGHLSGLLLDQQIATTEIYRSAFKAAVANREADRAVEIWWRGLASVSGRTKAKAYMAETQMILEREDRDDLLAGCFQAALDHGVGERLGAKVKQEILLQYGALLFDDDAKRHKSLGIYREIHAADPADSRSWMPLYFLLQEYGTPEARYAHLADVIPRLEQDARPLKTFPITIESMRAEFVELAEQVGASSVELKRVAGEARMFTQTGASVVAAPPDTSSPPSRSIPDLPPVAGLTPAAPALPTDLPPVPELPALVDLSLDDVAPPDASAIGASLIVDVGVQVDLGDLNAPVEMALADEPELEVVFNLPDIPTPEAAAPFPVAPPAAAAAPAAVEDEVTPGAFSLDPAAPLAENSIVAQAPEPTGAQVLFELNAVAGAPLTTPPVEISSVELAAAIDLRVSSDADPTTVEGTGEERAPAADEEVADAGEAKSALSVSDPQPTGRSAVAAVAGDSRMHEQRSVLGAPSPVYGLEGGEEAVDWRVAIFKSELDPDLTNRLLRQAFASELEKHLAIQCVAVAAGNCDRLNQWHWRVWRQPEDYGYARAGKERYPPEATPAVLSSSLQKFVLTASPLMVRLFKERFTLGYLAQKLQQQPGVIERQRRPLAWNEGILGEVGLKVYADRLIERRFVAFNLPGLGKELFYEGGARALYLDEAYYRQQPPTHLFHRVLGMIWSVRNHTFVPLALHPQKQVMPVLREVHQHFLAQGLSKIKSRLSANSKVTKYLGAMDTRQLRALHEKVGLPTEEQVQLLWEAMRVHLFRLLLAETLDVVGIFEMLTGRDLTQPAAMKPGEVFQLSPQARSLLEFAARLRLTS